MSERVSVNVPATPDFVRLYPSIREKVIHMLPRALQVGHRVGNRHQRWEFTLPHSHLPCSPPRPIGETQHQPEAKPKRPYTAKRPSGSTVGSYAPD